MKKFILSLLLVIVSVSCYAAETWTAYCSVHFFMPLKVEKMLCLINIDKRKAEALTNDKYEFIYFDTPEAALTYLSKLGWKVESSFIFDGSSKFLLSKEVSSEEQIKEGIYTKDKNAKEKK